MRWKQVTEGKNSVRFIYEAKGNKRIQEIHLFLHHPKVTLSLTLTPETYVLFQNYFEYHAEFGFSNANGLFMTDMGNHCTLTFDEILEKDVLDRFMAEVLRFDPSIMEVIPIIKKTLKSEESYGISDDISQELTHGHFGIVLESAKHLYKVGNRDVLLKIAQKCFGLKYFNEGLAALDAMDESDRVGHFQAAHLILENKEMPEKIMNRYELALKHLFKCGNDPVVQQLRDRIYAYCSGAPESPETVPKVTGVRLNDPEVFFAIGDIIRDLNTKKREIIEELKRLQGG